MLNFKEYKEQYLNELSKTKEYYLKNLAKIKQLDGEFDEDDEGIVDEFLKENSNYRKLYDELSKLFEKYQKQSLITNDCYEDCVLNIKITDENKQLVILQDKIKAFRNYRNNYLEKLGISKGGISASYINKVLSTLFKWTNDADYIDILNVDKPILHNLTVRDIPNKIYRGIVINFAFGYKPNMKYINKKYYDQLIMGLRNGLIKQGSILKYDFGKTSSWTIDSNIATFFARRESGKIDGDNKCSIVISHKPKKEDIVADLRHSSISNITGFHHELEIVLDKGVRDYTVEKIICGDLDMDIDKNIKNSEYKNIKYNILSILSKNSYKLIKDKESLESAIEYTSNKMTLDDLMRKYYLDISNNKIKKELGRLHPRIAAPFVFRFMTKQNNFMPFMEWSVVDKDEIMFRVNNEAYGIVKFSNYDKLFRPIGYKIIKTKDNIESDFNEKLLSIRILPFLEEVFDDANEKF